MMNKYIIAVCILLCSCNGNRATESFFDKKQKLSGSTVHIDCLIGRPLELVSIDSLLIFYDPYEGKAATVFDVKNSRFVRRFLCVGQGPEDVILPLKLSVSGGRLNVFQVQRAFVYEYDVTDIVDTTRTRIVRKCQLDDRPANIGAIVNGFVGIGMYEKGRYKLYDDKGKTDKYTGKYPFRGEDMNPHERFFVYQGIIRSSPDGSCFVMGSSYCDNLEFYRVDKGEASLVKKYETYDVKGSFDQRTKIDADCVMSYRGASVTDKYCYMLYSGEHYGVRTAGGKYIIVFDWKGNYVKTFEVDKNVASFCVNRTDDVLFAFIYDENEGFLMSRYDLCPKK
jgi:hypothetical protein